MHSFGTVLNKRLLCNSMVKIKSAGEIDKAFKDSISRVPANYKAGVQRTTDWNEKAGSAAAEQRYADKLAESIAAKRRQKAVAQVSNADWQNKAANVGAANIGQGMTRATDKRMRNFEPYRSAIEGAQLPEKTTDPMANVTNRVGGIVKVLVDTKKAIKG